MERLIAPIADSDYGVYLGLVLAQTSKI
jgi:hypothetical protein